MLYPPTNSSILFFSTFDTPSWGQGFIPPLSKRTPFGFQKESFCYANVVLLAGKTNPFATQKDSFWKMLSFKC